MEINNNHTYFINEDITYLFLSYLDIVSLVQVARTNKNLHEMIDRKHITIYDDIKIIIKQNTHIEYVQEIKHRVLDRLFVQSILSNSQSVQEMLLDLLITNYSKFENSEGKKFYKKTMNTAFLASCHCGNKKLAKKLLATTYLIDLDYKKNYALRLAAMGNHLHIMKWLKKNYPLSTNITLKNFFVLRMACINRAYDTVVWILKECNYEATYDVKISQEAEALQDKLEEIRKKSDERVENEKHTGEAELDKLKVANQQRSDEYRKNADLQIDSLRKELQNVEQNIRDQSRKQAKKEKEHSR